MVGIFGMGIGMGIGWESGMGMGIGWESLGWGWGYDAC